MSTNCARFMWAILVLLPTPSFGQDERPTREGQPSSRAGDPYVLFETRPVILHGPYLVAPSETSVVIAWTTDTPCHSKVVYGIGQPTIEATNARDGLLPVSTNHSVRITGLKPGQTYAYKVISTRVVKLKGYWPDKGLSATSDVSFFTTFDATRPAATFYSVSDTHEDSARIAALMKLGDWKNADFLLHTGDAFHTLDSEDQLFDKWLDPILQGAGRQTPLIYARGNHDTRGAFARNLATFMPIEEGRFYYARDIGPVHLVVVDTGEDKPDTTNVYARLNAFAPYRQQELAWLEDHLRSNSRMKEAPFRIATMHQPAWGYVEGGNERWTDWANRAKIDLVIAGHTHRFAYIKPGERRNDYPILIVGQDQLAKVEVTATQLKASVAAKDGSLVHSFILERKAAR